MTHALQIKEEKLKKSDMETKRAQNNVGDYFHQKFDSGVHSQFRQRYSGLAPSSTSAHVPKFNKDMVSNLKYQSSASSGHFFPTCLKYGKITKSWFQCKCKGC